MKIVSKDSIAEIEVKKSRFIGRLINVRSEEEAKLLLEEIRRENRDANHNCYAMRIGDPKNVLERFSDDGEPQGTAGKPILELLKGNELYDVLAVVTRYFGGTLLGTGGLVRAYTKASQEALEVSTIITRISGVKLKITTEYTGIGKVQYILGQRKIPILASEYTEKVETEVLVSDEEVEMIIAEITEGTNGQAEIEKVMKCSFAEVEGEYLVWEL